VQRGRADGGGTAWCLFGCLGAFAAVAAAHQGVPR
jgi:hypothetical protein